MQPEANRSRGPEPQIPRVRYKYNADRLQCIVASIAAQAESQLAQQKSDAQPAPPSSAFDMAFDCLGLDMAPAITATTATTTTNADTASRQPSSLLTPTSPILGGNHPFARGFLPNGMLGEPLSDIDMADAFLLDAHADWYALCFPMAFVRLLTCRHQVPHELLNARPVSGGHGFNYAR